MLSRVIERSGAVPAQCAVTAERPETQSPKLVVSTPVGSFGEDSVFEHISPSPSGAPGESSLGGADSALHQEALFEVEAETDGEHRQVAATNGAAALPYGHLRAPAGTEHAAPKPFNMAFGWPGGDAPPIGSISSSLKAMGSKMDELGAAVEAKAKAAAASVAAPAADAGPRRTEAPPPPPLPRQRSNVAPSLAMRSQAPLRTSEAGDATAAALNTISAVRNGQQTTAAMPISGSLATGVSFQRYTNTEDSRQAFQPPHEMAAASYHGHGTLPSSIANSSRHKSIADRLKAVVFEQSGFQPMVTAKGFLE